MGERSLTGSARPGVGEEIQLAALFFVSVAIAVRSRTGQEAEVIARGERAKFFLHMCRNQALPCHSVVTC
jgi:hypothetical protein